MQSFDLVNSYSDSFDRVQIVKDTHDPLVVAVRRVLRGFKLAETSCTYVTFQIFTCRPFLRLHFQQVEFVAVMAFRFETSAKCNQNNKLSDYPHSC